MLHSIPLGILSFSSGGYQVDNSIMLDDGTDQFLSRTPSSAGNLRKWTFSCWIKLGSVAAADRRILSAGASDGASTNIRINSSHQLDLFRLVGGSFAGRLTTNRLFRDPHAWYNIVASVDTEEDTAGNRFRLYVNGEEETSFATESQPDEDSDLHVNSANLHKIGEAIGGGENFDGYIAEAVLVDGSQLAASSFGEYDSNAVWRPVDVSGISLGTNGFYLDFKSSGNLGEFSGKTTKVKNTAGSTEANYNDGGGHAATKDGNRSQNRGQGLANSGTNNDILTPGRDFGTGTAITGARVFAPNDNGFEEGGGSGTARLYGSDTSNNAGDKSLQGSASYTGATGEVIAITGATGTFDHWWVELETAGSGNSTNCAELEFFTGAGTVSANYFVESGSPTQSNDSPTKNFCVLTPLVVGNGTATFSEGNLKVVQSGGGNLNTFGSIGLSSGKWHFEVTCTDVVEQFGLGIIPVGNVTGNTNQFFNNGIGAMQAGTGQDGKVYNNGSNVATITAGSASDGQTFSCEIDLDNDQLEWFNNAGSSLGTYSFTPTTANGGRYLPCVHCNDDATYVVNFGASTFSKTPSTGFTAISAAELIEQITPTIEDGTAYFQATKYEGNGTAISGTGTGKVVDQSGNSTFKPDFVWIKNRDQNDNHMLYDAVRGETKDLHSNASDAQNTDTEGLSTFDSDGFTVGNNVEVNTNTENYIAWQWKGSNTSGSTNDDGNIDSTVNVNTTAGFVVGQYTTPSATAAVRTVGHGLGAALDMLFVKNQASGHWAIWHNGIGNEYLRLNSNDAKTSGGTETNSLWNATLPSASTTTFSIGTNSDINGNNVTFSFIGFRAIPGYSAFGSYEGNTDADGPFISLGFTPAYVIIKRADTAGDWVSKTRIIDPANPLNNRFLLNEPNSESSSDYLIDILSNGFKIRDAQVAVNGADTLVYAAWADHPFAGTTPATAR